MRAPCSWRQGLRGLGALALLAAGLDLRYGLLLAGGPSRASLDSGVSLRAPSGAPATTRGPSEPESTFELDPQAERWQAGEIGCQSSATQVERLGDLEGESDAELASRERVLTLVELEGLRRTFSASGSAPVQDRAATQADAARCSVLPEPRWEVDLNGDMPMGLRYRDNSSRHRVAVDVDLKPQPKPDGQHPAVALPPAPEREEVFAVLRNRWVYFHGDSTLRQVCCELVKYLSDMVYSFKEFKNLVRFKIDPFGVPFRSTAALSVCIVDQPMEWEFWQGRCENSTHCECDAPLECTAGICPTQPCNPLKSGNEVTFTWHFAKLNLTMTFDWKAQALQRYDRWLLQRRFTKRAPDLYIATSGMHDCFWPVTRHLGADYQATQLGLLFDYMASFLPKSTHVIWLPGQVSRGRLGAKGYEGCLAAVNGAAREQAASRGFTFLDRERVLASLLSFAEEHTMLNWFLDLDAVHFVDWVQLVIRQYLLSTILCVLRP